MATLRVFFYGMIALARRSSGDTVVVLLDQSDHEPYVAFDAVCTGSNCPKSKMVECKEIPKRDLDREDIILSYTSQGHPPPLPNPPSSHLPNNSTEGRHIKWVPKMSDVLPNPGPVDRDRINSGNGIVARMELDATQFRRLLTCRLVEHDRCFTSGKAVHAFDFLPATGPPAHKQALAEVLELEDSFQGSSVTLTLKKFNSTQSDTFELSPKPGQSSVDIFVANLPGHVFNECDDRLEGQHFTAYYDLLKNPPNPGQRPIPKIRESDFKPAGSVRPNCRVDVLCSAEVDGQARKRRFFDVLFKSPNSRPVCPMVVIDS